LKTAFCQITNFAHTASNAESHCEGLLYWSFLCNSVLGKFWYFFDCCGWISRYVD